MATFVRLTDGKLINMAYVVKINRVKDRGVVVTYMEGEKVVFGTAYFKPRKDHSKIAYDLTLVASSVASGVVWVGEEGSVVSVEHATSNALSRSVKNYPTDLRNDEKEPQEA